MKFGRADLFSILKDVKRQGKRIKLKRRWLLGLPITKRERKKLKENRNRYLPELLRKDDMFYESVRTHVERAFGAHHIERVNSIPHDDKDLNRIPDSKRLILSCLDNLTTKGLYLLAMIVSGVTAKYERTRGCCSQGFLKARIFRRCNTVLQTRGYDFPNNIVLVILCIRAAIKTQQRSQNQKISGVSQAGSGGGSLNIRRNTHGILNAVSWGILIPLGAVIARYLKVFKSADPALFYLHVSCQTAVYIVGVAGWGTGLKLGSDSAGITYSTHVDHRTIDYCREYLFNPQRLVSFSTIQVII